MIRKNGGSNRGGKKTKKKKNREEETVEVKGDTSPEKTVVLMVKYIKKILGQDVDKVLFSQKEVNKFVVARERLEKFLSQVNGSMNCPLSWDSWCSRLIDSVKGAFNDPHIGNLTSEYTFEKIFPAHLVSLGLLNEK